jgi:hypothetical protein
LNLLKKDFEIVSASIENKIEKITLAKRYFMQEIFNKIEEEE